MRLKGTDGAEGRRDDMDKTIASSEKEVRGSGAKAREVALLQTSVHVIGKISKCILTPNSAELSSGILTGETSIKLNAFHYHSISKKEFNERPSKFSLMSKPFGPYKIEMKLAMKSTWSFPR